MTCHTVQHRKLQLIREWSEFDELKSEWNDLLDRSDANCIFLTWEWIYSWRLINPDTKRPYIVTVRDLNNTLIGIAPLYLTSLNFMKTVHYRTLQVLADSETGAEYPNFICSKEHAEDVNSHIFEFLQQQKADWDCIWLPNMSAWKGFESFHSALVSRDGLNFNQRKNEFSSIQLPKDFNQYQKSLSKSLRTDIGQVERRISRTSKLQIAECGSLEQIDAYLDTLLELHHKRWKQNDQCGAFNRRPKMTEFYQAFTPLALKQGWLKFYSLNVDGQAKAIQIGYEYQKTFYALQEGFDPHYLKGVGNLLRSKSIQKCIENGMSEYDFLGDISNHKRRWKAEARNGFDIFIWNNNLRNAIFAFSQIWPTGRLMSS